MIKTVTAKALYGSHNTVVNFCWRRTAKYYNIAAFSSASSTRVTNNSNDNTSNAITTPPVTAVAKPPVTAITTTEEKELPALIKADIESLHHQKIVHDEEQTTIIENGNNDIDSESDSDTNSNTAFSNNSNDDNSNNPYIQGKSTHFGYQSVPVEEKEGRVENVFSSVATSYDTMNDLMSGGLHRYWKDYLLDVSAVESMANIVRQQSSEDCTLRILDVAGGTGDLAFRFVDAANCVERAMSSGQDEISVTVCDINAEMLRVGRARAIQKYGSTVAQQLLENTRALQFVKGNAQDLSEKFKDSSFDLYTIAFGLRNVTDVDQALREAYRVLKPGGRFMCLEFSHVPNDYFRTIYDAYSFNIIPAMGEYVANDRNSYQYLVESIRQFPKQDELISRMQRAGFHSCQYTNLTGGIVALHEGYKQI